MFAILIPIVGIALATTIIAYLVSISPIMSPFKDWIWWGVVAIGVLWILIYYVLPLFGVNAI